MEQLKPLEEKLASTFKGAPPLPEGGKKWLVQYVPWLALISGVLQLLWALRLFDVSRDYNRAIGNLNSLSRAFGGADVIEKLNIFYWISLVALVVNAIIILLAYPGLKERKKAGWNMLFLGAVVSLAFGIISLFDNSGRGGFGSLLGSIIGAAIGFYLLFQIRDHYGTHGKNKPEEKPAE